MRIQRQALWLLSLILLFATVVNASDRVLYDGESAYTGIQVVEKQDGLRYMQFGIYEQTAMRMTDPAYLHYPYARTVVAGMAFVEQPVKKILLLGLGGGTMPHFLAKRFPEAELDIFEIDPLVVEIAERFFKFKPGEHGAVSVGDGRRLLRKSQKRYDLIILDAYKAGGIPFHLTTEEFLLSVKDHLAPGGVVAVHLWAEYANSYLQAQVKTISKVFAKNYSFYDKAGSFLIFATEHARWLTKERLVARGTEITRERKLSFDLGQLIAEQFSSTTPIPPVEKLKGEILTDDFAPVNLLRQQEVR
ncbi:MAG: hypothetical protein C0621_10430 [Desulfuromonas sp.]|nr:MAG: hypothetical protein C0621_10430 [Desulfuromonas sp.]